MRVRLKPNETPIRVKARRYSPDQRAFLDKYLKKLLELDFCEEMPTASWHAAPLLVLKNNSKSKYRLAIDLRPVNAATTKESWPMPHLDSEVLDFRGSAFFAILDFVSAYWQLPLHPESYTLCGIVGPKGVIVSKRVLPGLANATSHFQSTVEPLFQELRDNMKAWLDDFNLHAKNEEQLLSLLERFLTICRKYGLYLSAKKCVFFSKSLKWCGRIIKPDSYTLDPSRIQGLRDMDTPKTADELLQFVHCCRWMSLAIPDFAKQIAPLTSILEDAYNISGKRTKRSVKNIQLSSLSWGAPHRNAFIILQDTLRRAVELSYPDPEMETCVFTDASDRYWSAVVTQCAPKEIKKPVTEQTHKPLAFLGSQFKNSELSWTTFEKEGFAIFQTFTKLDYLLMSGKPPHVYTDHRNLLFIFAPLTLEPALGRHVVSKVQRWALYLSRFPYVIEHVNGEDNVFADILTRWCRGYRNDRSQVKTVCSLVAISDEQMVPSADEVEWPDVNKFRISQEKYANDVTNDLELRLHHSERLWKRNGNIWIPHTDEDMKLKLLVVSHCGSMGHRGAAATKSVLKEMFYWKDMDRDAENFVSKCFHCILTRSGGLIPRPIATALHGQKPNEVLHMDFLYMGPGINNRKYILVLRDDLSSYVWLWPAEKAESEEAAAALTNWIGAFGMVTWVVSDQGSHFKNKLIHELTAEFHVKHHFSTAYSPWANGSVERVCREVIRSCKALCSEWRLAAKEWPAVVECVQSMLNHAPLRRLGLQDINKPGVYRTPLEVFTGCRAVRPLMHASPFWEYEKVGFQDEVHLRQLLCIDQMQAALADMHKEVNERASSNRRRHVEAHNRKTNIKKINFTVGDFVLVRRAVPSEHKMRFTWTGPRRIVNCKSEWVYEVEHLQQSHRETVHARRLILYRSNMDGKPVEENLLKAAAHTEAVYQDVHELRGIRRINGQTEIQIEWDGLPDHEDRTWEPLLQVHDDVPHMLHDFLHSSGQRALKRQALDQVSSL